MYATSMIQLLATPVLAITLFLLIIEAASNGLGTPIGIFDPALDGDPILFQHMFWFYSHPAVYIMIIPGMGVISEILTCFSRKNIFGYTAVAWSSVGIAVIGFLVWAHHMFVAGISYLCGARVLVPDDARGSAVGDQGLQLGRDALPRARSASRRR